MVKLTAKFSFMEEFDKIEIQHICSNICSGGTPKSTIMEYYGGNIPWLNTKEINFSRIYDTEKKITEEGFNNSSAKWIPENSVIVAMYGATAGKTAIAKIPLTTNQACCNLTINSNKADYRFVYYALCNDYAYLASLANGGAQQNLNAQQIKEFEIHYPPLDKQKRIADILSSLDDKIELNRRINDNLEQQAQALFKAWFVDNAVIDDASVSDYFIPLRGKNLLTSDAKGGEVPVVAGGLTPSAYHNVANTKAPVITISASGANAGYVNLWGVPVWSADSSYIDSSVTPHIYFWYNLLKFSQKNIFDSQTGSAQPHIYPKHIGDIHIPNLDLDKVADYNKIVTPIYEQITNTQKLNMQLTVTRDTLLPKLMSGEIKI